MQKYDVAHMGYAPFGQGKINEVYDDDRLKEIAEKYNKSTRQVVLRYLIQRNIIVIPKSKNPERMKDNLNIFDFELSQEDMEVIRTFDKETPVVGSSENPELVEMSFNW